MGRALGTHGTHCRSTQIWSSCFTKLPVILDDLHDTSEYYKCTPLAERIDDRAKAVRYWLDRDKSLSTQEQQLRNRMDPLVANVLKGKHIALWKVVHEFVSGTMLTGNIKPSGL